MQEEEGFDDSQRIEIVEFDYRPIHVKSQIKKRPSNKPQEQWQATRDSNRGQWAQSVVMRQPQNVVFSSNFNQVALPETQLLFEADFEGSNLDLVIRKRFLEYELYIRPDTNTDSYFQWFDFKVKCCKGPKTASFTIKNIYKSGMLYSEGLKPFYRRNNKGNFKQLEGESKYYENVPEDSYCLKFSFDFKKEGQEVQFSSQPPYSYTKMINLISEYSLPSRTLCKSLLGKRVPYLTFNEQKHPKAIAVVIARQHPGQSVGSWMMEGLITKLQKYESAVQWIVVPMMCVDGVILGNNRTGLPGYDYNRFWNIDELNKRQKLFPQIVGILNVIRQIRRMHPKKPKIFLDLHGHSSQPNIFTYGAPHEPSSEFYLTSRIFPELISRKNDNFSLDQCSNMIKPDKKNTIRGLLYYQYLLPFVYTIEASFGIMKGQNVNQTQYLKFGQDLVDVTQQFLLKYVSGEKTSESVEIIDSIKARGQQNQAVEYDSDAEQRTESKQKKIPHLATDRAYRRRVATQSPVAQANKQTQQTSFQLFRVQQSSNQRYMKPLQRKRTQTEVTISKTPKMTFLPKLKQSFNQKPKQTPKEEHDQGILMNIKQIQKKLHRLKNNRIGKKIMIINSYGV